jgi:hypothetical protein
VAATTMIVILVAPRAWAMQIETAFGLGSKAWYIDVDDNTKEQELTYLRKQIYQRDVELTLQPVTAYERFSNRI